MKRVIFLSVFSFIIFSNGKSQTVVDSVAVKVVEKNLDIISTYLKDKKSDPENKRVNVIAFLTLLTGIPSESDGNFIGQMEPTSRDFRLWQIWLQFYKTKIKWDEGQKVIVIHSEIAPPKW